MTRAMGAPHRLGRTVASRSAAAAGLLDKRPLGIVVFGVIDQHGNIFSCTPARVPSLVPLSPALAWPCVYVARSQKLNLVIQPRWPLASVRA